MNHQTKVYESIFEMLPSEENPTPLVRINKLNPRGEFGNGRGLVEPTCRRMNRRSSCR